MYFVCICMYVHLGVYVHICVCVCMCALVCTWVWLFTCVQMGEKFVGISFFLSVCRIWWSKAFRFCVMSCWLISSTLMVRSTHKLGMTKNHNERESQWRIMWIIWRLLISAGICLDYIINVWGLSLKVGGIVFWFRVLDYIWVQKASWTLSMHASILFTLDWMWCDLF